MLESKIVKKSSGTVEGSLKGFLSTNGTSGGGKKFRKRRGRHRVVAPVLVMCAVVAVMAAVDYWSNAGKVYSGVDIGSAEVGGESVGEARGTIEAAGPLKDVRLVGPENVTLTSESLGIRLNMEATLERAYAFGREGSVFKRLGDRLDAAWGTAQVEPVIFYDSEVARAEVVKFAGRVNAPPTEATVSLSGDQVEVGESTKGYETDVEGTLANVNQAVGNLTGEAPIAGRYLEPEVTTEEARQAGARAEEAMSGPVTLAAGPEKWELSPAEIGQVLDIKPEGGRMQVSVDGGRMDEALSGVYDTLTVDPVEASFVMDDAGGISVTESTRGKEIDQEKFLGDLRGGLFEGKREYEVPVIISKPELTTAEAEELKPTDLIGNYRTNYTLSSDKSAERVDNLAIASGAVSGVVLAPGEVFSFNEWAAPLDYNETHVIVDGAETFADGGGLCQVASTLFNAANYAGLEIVERNPHASELPYIRPGLDATVWFGALDMRFKNTTDGYIMVQESVSDDGYIYASIYGQPNGTEVQMGSEPNYRGEYASEWVTYKKVTQDGEVIFDDAMFTTSYDALIDEYGRMIPPTELTPAPVIP